MKICTQAKYSYKSTWKNITLSCDLVFLPSLCPAFHQSPQYSMAVNLEACAVVFMGDVAYNSVQNPLLGQTKLYSASVSSECSMFYIVDCFYGKHALALKVCLYTGYHACCSVLNSAPALCSIASRRESDTGWKHVSGTNIVLFQGQTLCSLSQGTEISLIQHCTVVLTCITGGIMVRVTGKVVYLQYQHQQRLSSAVASTCTTKDITVRMTCKNVCATNRGCQGAAVLTGYAICATVANVHVTSVELCY